MVHVVDQPLSSTATRHPRKAWLWGNMKRIVQAVSS